MHACTHTCTHARMHSRMHTVINAHMHTYTHTHICTNMYAHMYIYNIQCTCIAMEAKICKYSDTQMNVSLFLSFLPPSLPLSLPPSTPLQAVYDISKGESELTCLMPWLLNIQARAPSSPVIVIGTHIDKLNKGEGGREGGGRDLLTGWLAD